MPNLLRNSVAAAVLSLCTTVTGRAATEPFTCASCHTEAKTQPQTDMAHAIERPAANAALEGHPQLDFHLGPYSYSINALKGSATYSVTDGIGTLSVPLLWPFGRNSQTYVIQRDGKFYESLVTFYPATRGLDRTMGDQDLKPTTLVEAMGRQLSARDTKNCFGCHSTGSGAGDELKIDSLTPGITCERCHTETRPHLEAFTHGQAPVIPPSLKHRSAEETSTFCGQCHRTWQTVVKNRWLGVANVRFQPYRLANSRCYDGVDERISCVSCHNPHQQLVEDDTTYDGKCLACHRTGARLSAGLVAEHRAQPMSPKVCPVAKENCVSCHMPKVDLPGAHKKFTDHNIRVVKPNEAYPE